jgi:hypothetical protein
MRGVEEPDSEWTKRVEGRENGEIHMLGIEELDSEWTK